MSTYNGKIQDKAVLVVLGCSFSWGTVTDKQITDETNDNKGAVRGALRVRKTLLPQASGVYVQALQSSLGEFYRWHGIKTFSTPKIGERVMPVAYHMEYEQRFAQTEATNQAALKALVDGYDDAVNLARSLLGSSFKDTDYPPAEEIPQYYKFSHRFLPVPTGDAILNALGAGVAADVDSYLDEIMKCAAKDAKKRLRDAVERMAKQKDGKIFDSTSDLITQLANDLPEIAGLAGDAELDALVAEVKGTLSGYDGDTFRSNDALRTEVGLAADAILKKFKL